MGSEVLALWLMVGCKEKYKPPEESPTDPFRTAAPSGDDPEADEASATYLRFDGSSVSVGIRLRSGRVDGVKVSIHP